VSNDAPTPRGLIVKLAIYFAILLGTIIAMALTQPDILKVLPLGGTDALEIASLEITEDGLRYEERRADPISEAEMAEKPLTSGRVALIIMYLSFSLGGTVLIMLPITWTYMATKRETGFRRNFVRALIALPICATTIVLLIQDSLALAFGLAALVAAVRFRVALREAIDGIYIFAAICVGLAAGIGFLGIATVMALFFCMSNAIMWQLHYGKNPIDDAKREKKRIQQQS
jgi:hypothetical protein